jgi:hypothetical protein
VSRPADLVGYAYRADLYCLRCVLRGLTGRDPVGIGNSAFLFTVNRVEAALDHEARLRGIDRTGAEPFDSGEFPAVELRNELATCDHCQGAGRIELLYGPRGRQYHGRWVRCGECEGSASPDRCGRCRHLLAEGISS